MIIDLYNQLCLDVSQTVNYEDDFKYKCILGIFIAEPDHQCLFPLAQLESMNSSKIEKY